MKEPFLSKPLVSVVVPCKNEQSYIAMVIENILAQDYPADCLEIFLIDGKSSDGTLLIIESYTNLHAHLHLLNNDAGTVPHGLNKAITMVKGTVFLRMDAHCIYPQNYISELVRHLFIYDADNVGGVCNIQPGADTVIARTIAFCNGHPFGIGNAQWRYAENGIREVDTVPFGCYKMSVFEKIGCFDEDLIRNQDDEFNARLKKSGGNIFLIPSIKCKYFARDNLSKMARMFYQYGLYKPLGNKKLGSISTFRQLVPVWFVLFLLSGALTCLFRPQMFPYFLIFIAFYLLVAFLASVSNAFKQNSIAQLFLAPICFFTIHISYGVGYLKGLILVLTGKKPSQIKLNR
ncbi:glycosyltransferase family 2 protein [Opitutales bacterium]|nr:glycosyltransferase family 2 protein [Opitutales bacterium]